MFLPYSLTALAVVAFTISELPRILDWWQRPWRSSIVQSYPTPLVEPLPTKRGPLTTVWGGPCCGKTHPSPTEAAPQLRRYFYLGNQRYAKYSWDVTRWLFIDICDEAEYLNASGAAKASAT